MIDISRATRRERLLWFTVLTAGFFWVEFFLSLALNGTRHVLLDGVFWLVASAIFAALRLTIAFWRLVHRE